jgi:hypothetical protein
MIGHESGRRGRSGLQGSAETVEQRGERLAAWGMRVALALGLAEVVAHLVDYGAFELKVGALDSNRRSSVFGLISLLALAAAAIASLRLVVWRRMRMVEGSLLGGALLLLLALRLSEPSHVLAISVVPASCALVVL